MERFTLFFSGLLAILIWMSSPSVKASLTVGQSDTPFPFSEYEARYTINWHGLYAGASTHKLHKRENGQYHFETRTEPHLHFLPFHYVESSDFSWIDGKILPDNYYYNIQEGKRHKEGSVLFDRQTQKIKQNRVSHQTLEAELIDGLQDKLTQTFSLRQALKNGDRSFTYPVAENDKIKEYTFKIVGEEKIQTKLGRLKVIKVEHLSRKGHRTVTWLAPQYDYLPVKMTQYRNGKQVAGGEILSFTQA